MAVSELLYEAGLLMLVGMVVVFTFLTILIFATKALSKFVLSLPAEESLTAPVNTKKTEQAPSNQKDIPAPVVAAISAAIKQYKKK